MLRVASRIGLYSWVLRLSLALWTIVAAGEWRAASGQSGTSAASAYRDALGRNRDSTASRSSAAAPGVLPSGVGGRATWASHPAAPETAPGTASRMRATRRPLLSDETIGTGARFAPQAEQGAVMRTSGVARRTLGGGERIEGPEIVEAGPADDLQFMTDELAGDGCCAANPCGGCVSCCWMPCPTICWENFSLFGGVQGFTGPPNLGSTGSFGFHEGVNYGAPLPCMPCSEIGWQLGARFTQSNLSGAEMSLAERNQAFLTAGLFRRVDWGVQGGVVFDWLHEDWYYQADVGQVRGELSWVYPCRHEFGFWFAASSIEDTVTSTVRNNTVNGLTTWGTTDLYAFFYRRRFGECDAGVCRVYAGFSGESDGLIGADAAVPITANSAFQVGFAYLVPDQAPGAAGNQNVGHSQEGWNLAMSVVWYPGCSQTKEKNYYRPLFNVADNGSLMLDRR